MKQLKFVISKGNMKLGNIPSFSLPAIKTCPGATSWCSSKCYAHKLERIYPNVRKSYETNLEATNQKNFIEEVSEEISTLASKKKNPIKTFRIHVSGDFNSSEYIHKWITIVNKNPNVTFYAYTRSWMKKELVPDLEQLKSLPNMILLASTDEETVNKGIIPSQGWRVAYAGDSKPTNSSYVFCLEQAGKLDSCENCKLCFNKNIKNINIYFETH